MFLCMWNRMCNFLGIIFNFYVNLYVFNSERVVLQKRQVTVLPWGVATGIVRGAPQSLDC